MGKGYGYGRGRGGGRGACDALTEMDDTLLYGGGCCVGLAVVITAIVLIVVSFSTIEPTEVGVRYDTVTYSLDETYAWEAGRYFIGPGRRFIKYPTTIQTVRYDDEQAPLIQARTRDGLPLGLSVSFNYRLQTDITALLDLYLDYGELGDVQLAYDRTARNSIRETASRFPVSSFVGDRENVTRTMQLELDQELRQQAGVIDSFELLQFTFPEAFEEARNQQRAAEEETKQASNEREVAEVTASTTIRQATIEAAAIITRAEGDAQQIVQDTIGAIASFRLRLEAEASALANIGQRLGFNQSELLGYLYLSQLSEAAKNPAITADVRLDVPSELDPQL